MARLIDILHYSTGSLAWGFLIGVLCLVLFFLLIKGWYKDATFTLITYVVGAVLGLILIFHCTLICGSLAIIRMADALKPLLTEIVEGYATSLDEYITIEESDEIVKELAHDNPLIAHYIGGGRFQGYTASELPAVMISTLKTYMRWYILRRVLWSLGFVILSAIIVIKTMERNYNSQRRTQKLDRMDRTRPTRTERRRVRRRI